MPAPLTTLRQLIKVTDYRGHGWALFSCPELSPCLSYASELFEIILYWRVNVPRPSFEPWHPVASRSTAHGYRVRWPLGYMGRFTDKFSLFTCIRQQVPDSRCSNRERRANGDFGTVSKFLFEVPNIQAGLWLSSRDARYPGVPINFISRFGVLLYVTGDQGSESTQGLPSVDDGRSSSEVSDDLVAVKSEDNLWGQRCSDCVNWRCDGSRRSSCCFTAYYTLMLHTSSILAIQHPVIDVVYHRHRQN